MFERVLCEGEVPPFRLPVLRVDGTQRTVEAFARRIDSAGGVLATVIDVTDQEQARQTKAALEQQRREMLVRDILTRPR